ncbi:glutamyl-tRNA reductase [Leekyejoonella antrihumi]|uniref:Glutamyl-tRNA reductase n=1 Tax=Leekyejoonella antrihumi TaxID=1660198 RepID=A0A563DWN9_9MICO|nr:glutamyl-tRNA reductase [Leekyejoonella antrihumi]TWP34708.1 glutamyl-tRNA reductase [Leekyejoonella antrihumi]
MSLVVVGISHRTAAVELLERVVLASNRQQQLTELLARSEHVADHVLLSTCNRLEVYAEVEAFHGAVTDISQSLSDVTAVPIDQLRDHLYVHFEDRAVAHLFSVAAGLDSVAVGESQILGQLRDALQTAQRDKHLGAGLSTLAQQALRIGKRAHTETGIDQVSRSLVQRALRMVEGSLGDLHDQRVVVVGAGAMSGLAAHTVARAEVAELVIVNRTSEKAQRLSSATGASWRPWTQLPEALAAADVVVSCTGAVGHVIGIAELPAGDRRQVLVDLGLPRDIDPQVAARDGVTLVTLEDLGRSGTGDSGEHDQVRRVQDLVTGAVADFLVRRRESAIIPTVAALRAQSVTVMDAELTRLDSRLDLSPDELAQVRLAMHRVVEKILHTPTVRMKQMAGRENGTDVAQLLQQLFDLDPHESRVSQLPKGGDLA